MSIEVVIVGIFFAVTFLIGIWERKRITIDDYWVNGRKTGKVVLLVTITSSFVGAGALISNAGVAFSGAGLATLALMGSLFLAFFIFGKYFAPKIREFGAATGSYTLPDFLGHRYSQRLRVAGLVTNLVSYSLLLALQILGIGIFVSAIGGMDPKLATLVGGAIVVAYTSIGGMRADIRTDIFQFVIMLALIFIFLPLIISEAGGIAVIGQLPTTFLTGQEFAPWYVFLLGFLFLGASNIVSADLWQRAYAGESARGVKWAMQYGGIIVFLFLIAGTLLGVYGKILVPEATANTVVPELLRLSLSPAVFGLIVAGFFAAIMSSADTILLVMSMTLVHDLYQKALDKKLSPERVLSLSRWTTLVIGMITVLLAVTVFSVVHLVIDAISFFGALLPAVIFGFYSKKPSEPAAFWSIVVGFITIAAFLFIAPVEAFIPGIIVSFLTYWIVKKIKEE